MTVADSPRSDPARDDGSKGLTYWSGLVASVVIAAIGLVTVLTAADSGMRVLGIVLAVLGSLFLSVNLAIRRARR